MDNLSLYKSLEKKRMLMYMILTNKISFVGKHKAIIEDELEEYDIFLLISIKKF